jgi:hypothetical protein
MKKPAACVPVLALAASALFADITVPRPADAGTDAVEGEGPAGYAAGCAIGMVGTVGVCSLAGGLLFYGTAVAARAMGNARVNPATEECLCQPGNCVNVPVNEMKGNRW